MDTTENNKIIAEFLGWILDGQMWVNNKGVFVQYADQRLKFHTDWNLLMEVVEKIESLKPIKFLLGRNWLGFEVKIYKTLNTQTHYCTIKYIKESGEMTITNGFSKVSKIKAVYNACIEFIEWYNKQ